MVDSDDVPTPAERRASRVMAARRGARAQDRPQSVGSWALNTLAILAILGALYLASSLLLPLILASLLALLLTPLVGWLETLHISRPAGAAIIVLGLGGSVVVGGYFVATQASGWVEQVPGAVNALQREIAPIRRQVESVSDAAEKVGAIAQNSDSDHDPARLVQTKGTDLRDDFLAQIQRFLLGAVVLFFLLYFLLAGSGRLRHNVVLALPDATSERRVFVIMRRMSREISRYLLSISVINTALGGVIAGLSWYFGLPNPVLWGAMAGLLNFVPYIGPTVGIVVMTAVSVTTLDGPQALAMPALFALTTSLEGQLITPTILGRSLALNPIFIFVALIFWGWLWGVIGALLAVPIMVSTKIICDNVPRLRPIGMVLGR